MKKFKEFITDECAPLYVMLFGIICIVLFEIIEDKSGYYCIYCGQGNAAVSRTLVENCYGYKPCPSASDSYHKFEFYLRAPKDKTKPKYVK